MNIVNIKYHTDKLKEILMDFHMLTGMSIGITDFEFNWLAQCPQPLNPYCVLIQSTADGMQRCINSDTELLRACRDSHSTKTRCCHAGLTDTATPIIKDEIILGYIIFGQVDGLSDTPKQFSDIYPYIKDLNLDYESLQSAYNSLRFFNESQIKSAASIIKRLSKYIWLEHLIHLQNKEPFYLLVDHINANLHKKLSVSELCRQFYISKNILYKKMEETFHCTVNEYITNRRVEAAQNLLCTTPLPVYKICEQVGIENYQYFCRRFKKETGLTPLQYRKQYANTSSDYNHTNSNKT